MADSWLNPSQPDQTQDQPKKQKHGGGILGSILRAPGNAVDAISNVTAPVAEFGGDVAGSIGDVLGEAIHRQRAIDAEGQVYSANKNISGYDTVNPLLTLTDLPGQAVRTYLAHGAGARGVPDALLALIGKEHTSGTQLVSKAVTGDPNKIKKLPLGVETVVDTATDPLTYLGLGASDAAKVGAKQAGEMFGKSLAERIGSEGTSALSDIQRSQLKTALRRNIVTQAGSDVPTADKAAEAILTQMDRNAQGGLKVLGRSVPGLTSDSTIGRALTAVNPQQVVGNTLQNSDRGTTLKGLFVRNPELANAVGPDARQSILGELDHTATSVAHQQSVLDAAAHNAVKGVDMSDPAIRNSVLMATDVASQNEPLQAAKSGVKAADTVVGQAGKEVASFEDKMKQVLQKQVDAETKLRGTAAIKTQTKMGEQAAQLASRDAAIAKQERQTVAARLFYQANPGPRAKTVLDQEMRTLQRLTDAREKLAAGHVDFLTTASDKTQQALADLQASHAAEITDMAHQHQFLRSLEGSAIDRSVSSRMAVQDLANTPNAMQALEAQGQTGPARVVDFIDQTRNRMTDAQQAAGLGAEHWDQLTPEYVPRYITKEGRDALKSQAAQVGVALGQPGRPVQPNVLNSILSSDGHIAARQLRPDLNIAQINDLMVQNGVLKPGQKFFDDNALSSTVRRGHQAIAAVEHSNMLDRLTQIVDDQGQPILRPVDKNYKGPADSLINLDAKGVKYAAHPEVAKVLNEASAVVYNDASLKALNSTTKKVTAIWRSLATAGPAFHARNEAGNIWLNYLGGVKNPKYYFEAAQIQHELSGVFKSIGPDGDFNAALDASKLSKRQKVIVKDALDRGVIDRGFFNTDLPSPAITGETPNPIVRALKGANSLNRTVGSAVENNARLAHYIAKVGQFGDPQAAADSVKKFLFDYGDLTATERDKFKAVVPFYTFMRKNVPLEIQQAIAQPGKFAFLNHLNDDLNTHGMDLRPDFPVNNVQDVFNMIPGVEPTAAKTAQAIAAPISPFPKLIAETATGKSLATGNSIRNPAQLRGEYLRTLLPIFSKEQTIAHKSLLQSLLGFVPGPPPTQYGPPPAAAAPEVPGAWLK